MFTGDHVGQDERLLLGSPFGAVASAYAEHRPDYAQAAVRWALERAPGSRVPSPTQRCSPSCGARCRLFAPCRVAPRRYRETWELRFANDGEVYAFCPECDEREFGSGSAS
jgi:hypothetical protein